MINKKWDIVLKDEFNKEYFKKLGIFVKNEYKTKTIWKGRILSNILYVKQ